MRVFWSLAGLVVLVVPMTLAVFFYVNERVRGDYVAYEQLNKIGWEHVTKGKLKTLLMVKHRYLEIRKPSAKGNTYVIDFADDLLNTYGRTGPAMLPKSFKTQSGEPYYAFVRPYQLLGYFATQLEGKEMVIMYVGWKNRDNSMGILTYMIPREVYENETFATRINDYMEPEIVARPLMPTSHVRDMGMCMDLSFDNQSYCDWYFTHRVLIENGVASWVKDGILPDEMAEYPLPM